MFTSNQKKKPENRGLFRDVAKKGVAWGRGVRGSCPFEEKSIRAVWTQVGTFPVPVRGLC